MEQFHYQETISIDEFFSEFLFPNRPCLLSNLTTDWKANEWCDGSKIQFELLMSQFGDLTVPVANCDVKEFNANPKSDWLFRDYMCYWQHQALINPSVLNPEKGSQHSNLYLKDWHFTRDVTNCSAYTTPLIFTSDWLNEFYYQRTDIKEDYKFVYMGARGSWTPLHYDVFRSYSWSSNVVGTKMWILFTNGDEVWLKNIRKELVYNVVSLLRNSPAGNYVENILKGDYDGDDHFCEFSVTTESLTNLKESELFIPENSPKHIRLIVVIQRKGETIFVPSGWHHQVHNLDDVISVNHNWINACNLHEMWINLSSELDRVRESISDCREMEGWHAQCQLILSSLAGMDYTMFCKFILIISLPRLMKISQLSLEYSELHHLSHIFSNSITHIRDFLLQQKDYNPHSELNEYISTFIPSSTLLINFLPSFILSFAASFHKHIIFIFFELSRILSVLREVLESKDFDIYIQDSKLSAILKIFLLDLNSIWKVDNNKNKIMFKYIH